MISNLVNLRVHRDPKPTRALLSWAIETTFRVEDVVSWLAAHGAAAKLVRGSKRPVLAALAAGIASGGTVKESAVTEGDSPSGKRSRSASAPT